MDNLTDYFSKGIVKHTRQVKALSAPLDDYLRIPIFTYFRVDSEGKLTNLVNTPEIVEPYYFKQLWVDDPHTVDPHLLRSGSLVIPTAFDPSYMQDMRKHAKVKYLLLILYCSDTQTEGFFFGTKEDGDSQHQNLFTHLDLLHSFARYFKREAGPLIERASREACNIKQLKGKKFFQHSLSTPLAHRSSNAQNFLDAISPLSPRERQCLDLFKQGKTAQNTAAILGLSQRTIEYYFERIKDKVGCQSKSDLLVW